jgi:hypothetical protein
LLGESGSLYFSKGSYIAGPRPVFSIALGVTRETFAFVTLGACQSDKGERSYPS